MRHEWNPDLGRQQPDSANTPAARGGSVAWQVLSLGRRLTLKRSLTFCMRLAIRPATTLRWLRFVVDFGAGHGLGRPHDDLLRKSTAAFFLHGAPSRWRLDLLTDSFRIAAELMARADLATLWQGGRLVLGTVVGRTDSYLVEMRLADHCGCRHEGAFSLRLRRTSDDYLLWTATFIFTENSGNTAAIGGMQGPKGDAAKRAIIAATRCMGGLRPKDAMLLVFQGLATSTGAPHVLAVSNAGHVINQRRAKRRGMMQADLDDYWAERGGLVAAPFGYRIPCPPPPPADEGRRRDHSKSAFWQIGRRINRACR